MFRSSLTKNALKNILDNESTDAEHKSYSFPSEINKIGEIINTLKSVLAEDVEIDFVLIAITFKSVST